jgi:hypothetical protein
MVHSLTPDIHPSAVAYHRQARHNIRLLKSQTEIQTDPLPPCSGIIGDYVWYEKRRHRFVTDHCVTGRAGRQA